MTSKQRLRLKLCPEKFALSENHKGNNDGREWTKFTNAPFATVRLKIHSPKR